MSQGHPKNELRQNTGMLETMLVVVVTCLFPPILLFGFFIVNPREEVVVLRFGKYVTTLKNQGMKGIQALIRIDIYWRNSLIWCLSV